MKLAKKVAGIVCCTLLCAGLSAQNQTVTKQSDSSTTTKSETNVENEYMSNVEDVIITELANSDDYDNKLVAIQYLESAINDGRSSPDMSASLDRLASEGISTQARTNGRVMNNFPDIRAKACDILAKVPTEDSKNTLEKVALNDNEPMVISAAIRALGDIGINNKDEVITTIAWAQKRNAVLNPTSSLAFEVLTAYEKLADTSEDKSAMIQSVTAIASNTHYVTPVRTKALDLLKKLQGSSKSGKSDKAAEK
jgi:hypothetical protein